MSLSNAAWLRRLPALPAAIILAGAMMGVLMAFCKRLRAGGGQRIRRGTVGARRR